MLTDLPKPTFSTREVATGLWALVALLLVIAGKKTRASFFQLLRSALKWKLLLPIVLTAGYVIGIVALLAKLDFWTVELRKETVFWFLFAGVALLFAGFGRAAEGRGFWRRLVLDQVKVTIIFEWLVNDYTFPLWVELLLLPALLFLIAADTLARLKDEFKSARKVTSWLLAGFGFFAVAFAVREAASHLDAGEVSSAVRTILIGPILSIAIIPLAYALALISAYEMLLIRLRFTLVRNDNRRLVAYAARKIFWRCSLRPRKIWQFWRGYMRHLQGLESRSEVDAVIRLSKSGRRGIDRNGDLVRPWWAGNEQTDLRISEAQAGGDSAGARGA